MTLTGFLLARIADKEEKARKALEERSHWPEFAGAALWIWAAYDGLNPQGTVFTAVTSYAPSPEDVLAQCAAERTIVETFVPPGESPHPGLPCIDMLGQTPEDEYWEGPCERHMAAWSRQHHSEWVIRCMASAYFWHPDYREEWAL